MEYEDTNILRTQYVDDLVEQRQAMEDMLKYQEIIVNEGEGMTSMVRKAETITGVLPDIKFISFRNSKTALAIDDLKQIDCAGCISTAYMFYDSKLPVKWEYNYKPMIGSSISSIGIADLTHIDLSTVKDAKGMFGGSLVSSTDNSAVPLYLKFDPNLDLSKLENMNNMFYSSLNYYHLGIYDLHLLKDQYMPNLKYLNNPFGTYGITLNSCAPFYLIKKMYGVKPETMNEFIPPQYITEQSNIDLTLDCMRHIRDHWDLSNLKTCKYLIKQYFYFKNEEDAPKIQELVDCIISHNLSNLEDISYMLYGNSSLYPGTIKIDLSNQVFDKLANVRSAFYSGQISEIYAGDCPNETITDIQGVFSQPYAYRDATEESIIDFSGWNLGAVTVVSSIVGYRTKLKKLRIGYNLGKAYTYNRSNNSVYTLDISSSSILDLESAEHVLQQLYDLNLSYNVANGGKLYTQSVKFNAAVKANLTPEIIAIATNKGWTVS